MLILKKMIFFLSARGSNSLSFFFQILDLGKLYNFKKDVNMKKRYFVNGLIILFSVIAFFLICKNSMSYELKVLTENSGENNYLDKDGKIKGHNTEIVREIMKRLNKNFDIKIVPWIRGYKLAQSEPYIAIFSMTRTAKREKMFKWVGPLHATKFILYKKKGSTFNILSLEDAKKVGIVGCYKGDVREKLLLSNGFTNLQSLYGSDANLRNLKKLISGHIDLWISSDHIAYKTGIDSGIDPGEFEKAYIVKKAYVYLAFSLGTPDYIVDEWRYTLKEIKDDGTYEKIMMKYPLGAKRITLKPRG
ncbi:MAG: transporter substrate-binding domain-containing protein [Desulfobacteraceae bacterium]|nr:transporter substrate-binding domain-containing protein [Desulfobacteraceae bacterium]